MALKEKRPQITKKYYLRKSEKQHNPGIDPTSPALQADFYHWSTREALMSQYLPQKGKLSVVIRSWLCREFWCSWLSSGYTEV